MKARIVVKDFWQKEGAEQMFSGTPNLTSIKFLLSDVATNNNDRIIMLADVKGAFLYGKCAARCLWNFLMKLAWTRNVL